MINSKPIPSGVKGVEEARSSPPNPYWFDPWLTLKDHRHEQLVQDLTARVLLRLGPEGKKPRHDLVRNVTDIIPVILANLIAAFRSEPQSLPLAVPMRKEKTTRYSRKAFHKLPAVIRALEEEGAIESDSHVFKVKRTTITPGANLKLAFITSNATIADTKKSGGEEIIRLSARRPHRGPGGQSRRPELVDYEDTSCSYALRRQMEEVNRFLGNHEITLKGKSQAPFLLTRNFLLRNKKDTASFDLHGRIFGGFWINLESSEREHIHIDGEPVATLDFDSMSPRLAYHRAGVEPPVGDLYDIPGLEGYRDGAKRGLNALLSNTSPMRRLPSEVKACLPVGWTAKTFLDAISKKHPALVSSFGKDLGIEFMFTESCVMLEVLERLRGEGVPALPIHDGLMVPRSKSEVAKEAMKQGAISVLGIELPVS